MLEPIVGANSVILLDGAAHMAQRKLMLPVIPRRADGAADRAGRRRSPSARSPRGPPSPSSRSHPRMQRLTLEIILRAVFGLDPGERLERVRDRLSELLAFGDSPLTLFGPPGPTAERILNRVGPLAGFFELRGEVDRLLFELIDERRASERRRAPRRALDAARGAPRGRVADVRSGAPRRADDAAGRRARDDGHQPLAWAFERLDSRARGARRGWPSEVDAGRRRLRHRDHPGDAPPPARAAEHRAAAGRKADRGRRPAL